MKQYVEASLMQFASCNICKNQSSWEKFTAKSSGVCTKSWCTLLRDRGQINPRFFLITKDKSKATVCWPFVCFAVDCICLFT